MSSGVKGRRRHGGPSAQLRDRNAPQTWQLVLGDCIVTCAWVAFSSIFAEVADHLHNLTRINEVALNLILIVAGLAMLAPVCSFFWGALINPVHNIALIVRGQGGIVCNLLRMVGQLAGAVVGCWAALVLVPQHHQGKFHMLSGKLREGVAMELGFMCEAALVFVINLYFLFSVDYCGPGKRYKDSTLGVLAPHLTTVLVCLVGAEFTGPSLNPYLSFAWNTIYQQHSMMEHIAVFWLGPLTGAVLSTFVWRWLAPAATTGAEPAARSSRDKAAGRAAAKALAETKKAQ